MERGRQRGREWERERRGGEGGSREGDLRLAGKLMTRRGWLHTGWATLVSCEKGKGGTLLASQSASTPDAARR